MANLLTQIVIAVKDQSKTGIKSFRQGMDSVSTQLESVNNQVKTFFAAKFSLDGIKSLIEVADNVKQLDARLKLATDSQQEFNQAQAALFDISQNTSTAVRENVGLFAKLNQSIKDLGGTTDTTLGLTDSIAKSIKLSGSTASESSALIRQLSQSLGSGVLRGDEFNSVMENGGRLAIALADGLGVSIGKLRQMAQEGELTSTVVINALQSQKDVLDTEFAQLPVTVGDAFQQVRNEFQKYIGDADSSTQATKNLSGIIQSVASDFTQLADTAVYAGTVLATAYGRTLVLSITNYAAAIRQSVIANREAAVAADNTARAAQRQAISARASVTAIETEIAALRQKIATDQAALSNTSQAAIGATALATKRKQLAVDTAALAALEKKLATATAESATAQRAAAASATAAASGAAKLMTVTNGLNAAFAGLIGFEIGTWLYEQSAVVRVVGADIARNAHKAAVALKYAFTGEWLNSDTSLSQQLDKIDQEYDQIVEHITKAAIYGTEQVKKHSEASLSEVETFSESIAEQMDTSVDTVVNRFADWGEASNTISQSLLTLSNGALQTLKKEAKQAFDAGTLSAAKYHQILHDVVQSEVARTGDKLRVLKGDATETGREMSRSFQEAALSGRFTQQQVQNVTAEYIRMAKTSGDVRLLTDTMKAAGIATEGTGVAAVALRKKVNDLSAAQQALSNKVRETGQEQGNLANSARSAGNEQALAQQQYNVELDKTRQKLEDIKTATENATQAQQQLNAARQQEAQIVAENARAEQAAADKARQRAAEDRQRYPGQQTINTAFTEDQQNALSALPADIQSKFEAQLAAAVKQQNINKQNSATFRGKTSQQLVDDVLHGLKLQAQRIAKQEQQSVSLNRNIDNLVRQLQKQNNASPVNVNVNTASGQTGIGVNSQRDADNLLVLLESFESRS